MISEFWDTIIFCAIISGPMERKAHHGRWKRDKDRDLERYEIRRGRSIK